MNQERLTDKLILSMFCGAVAVIATHISWLRELLLIWVAMGVAFVFFRFLGSIGGPRLEKLPYRRRVFAPPPVPVRYGGPYPQRSFHRKDYSVN